MLKSICKQFKYSEKDISSYASKTKWFEIRIVYYNIAFKVKPKNIMDIAIDI